MKNKKMLLFICSIIMLFCISSVAASDVDDELSLDEADSFEADELSVSLDDGIKESQDSDCLSNVASDADDGDKNQLESSIKDDDLIGASDNEEALSKSDVYFFTDQDYIIYGQGEFTFYIGDPISGNPVLTVDGEDYETQGNWKYVFEIPKDLEIGNHTLVFKYAGDEEYSSFSETYTRSVIPKIVVPDTIINRDTDILSLSLPKTANGVLSVQIGKYDKENLNGVVDMEIPLVNGTAIYSFKGMEFGKYNVTAKYVGDDFTVAEFSNNITVNPEVSFPTRMIRGDEQFVTANIPGVEGYMEYVVIVIEDLYDDEFPVEVPFVNGTARIPLKQLMLGLQMFQFNIVLTEGGKVQAVYMYNVEINVEKPVLKPVSTSVYYTNYYKVKITGIDKDLIVVGDNVTFKIGSKIIGTGKIDKNGYASIKMNLKPGSYKITTLYTGAYLIKKVTVKHILKLKAVKVKKSAKKLVLQATVKVGKKAIAKKKVTFKFNGKKYTAKTNKKGVAKVTITKKVLKKLRVGKKVKYQATYLKDTVKRTAKVKW